MKRPGISEAEWEVMEVLWRRSPCSPSEIIEALASHEWAPTTIRTMLDRLTKKKVVAVRKDGRSILFRPLLKREDCVRKESESFLRRVFAGAPHPLLLHFTSTARLSPEQIEDLERVLKNKRKEKS